MSVKIPYKYYTFLFAIAISFCSCKSNAQKNTHFKNYAFIVAGHTYGSPTDTSAGLYPSFIEHIKASTHPFAFGVFTGDIVKNPTAENWDRVYQQLTNIPYPVYFAPGNHDMGNRKLYKEMNGNADTCFSINEDVFLIFDNTKYGWNMDSAQVYLFNEALSKLSIKSRLFVFGHNVLWQDHFSCATSNSLEGKGPTSLFWTSVIPQLLKLPNPVYWFAGDVGGTPKSKNVSFVKNGNIRLITSGMGNGMFDNYLQIKVNYTNVMIDVIPLSKIEKPVPLKNYLCH